MSTFHSYLKLNYVKDCRPGLRLRKKLQSRCLPGENYYKKPDGIHNKNLRLTSANPNFIHHTSNVLTGISPLSFLSRRMSSNFIEHYRDFMSPCNSYILNKGIQQIRYIHTSYRHYIRNIKITRELKDLSIEKDLNELTKNLIKVKNNRTLRFKQNLANELKDNINLKSSVKGVYVKEHPKNIVNNFFMIVSQELGKDLKPMVTYSKNLSDWVCTYHLKWPDSVKITKRAANKKEASHKTALLVVDWLRQHNKINSNGMPILYDAKEMKNISRENARKILHFDSSTMDKLDLIYEMYKNNFLKYIASDRNCGTNLLEHQSVAQLEDAWPLAKALPKIMNSENYLTNEVLKLPIQNFR